MRSGYGTQYHFAVQSGRSLNVPPTMRSAGLNYPCSKTDIWSAGRTPRGPRRPRSMALYCWPHATYIQTCCGAQRAS